MQQHNRLAEGCPFRFPVGLLELGEFQPAQQCVGVDPGGACCLLNAAVRQQRDNRLLLFTPEFCAVSPHLPQSGFLNRASPHVCTRFGGRP
jgi:hypothetical protein